MPLFQWFVALNLRTRVKICGITRTEDALEAAQLGVDALGFVFFAKSPRNIEPAAAQSIISALPGFVTSVALFLDASESRVRQVLAEVDIDLLQFHGSESAEFCASFGKPYIKALGIKGEGDIAALLEQYASARSILLDSHAPGAAGGTGEVISWGAIPAQLRSQIILAGGLTPQNIALAIQDVRPYGVDLSSGVESAPGEKDSDLMAQLMSEVKRIDCA